MYDACAERENWHAAQYTVVNLFSFYRLHYKGYKTLFSGIIRKFCPLVLWVVSVDLSLD